MDGVHGEPLDRRDCELPPPQSRPHPATGEPGSPLSASNEAKNSGADTLVFSQGFLEMSQALHEIGDTLHNLGETIREVRTASPTLDPCLRLSEALAGMSALLSEMANKLRCDEQS